MDHPADALENFVEELSKKYKARKDEDTWEKIVKKIKDQVIVIKEEYDAEIKEWKYEDMEATPGSEIRKKAWFLNELRVLADDWKLN
jgi:DNA topoisomerase VI subunit B